VNILQSLKANAPPPSGSCIAVVTSAPQAINDFRRRGVRFVLEVTEGHGSGRRARIELIIELKAGGNRARMLSDYLALEQWCDCLGVDSATTLTELIGKLRDAAVGKRVEFELDCRRWSGGVDVSLIGVRLARERRDQHHGASGAARARGQATHTLGARQGDEIRSDAE
jgi:hypothetical protein